MKPVHTVVEKWPYRLQLQPGQEGAKEEFDIHRASGCFGTERYVEWTKGMEPREFNRYMSSLSLQEHLNEDDEDD